MTDQERELPDRPVLAPAPLPRRIPGRQAIPGPSSLRPAAAVRLPRTVPDPDCGSRGAFEPPPKTTGPEPPPKTTGPEPPPKTTGPRQRPDPPAAPARQAPGTAATDPPWPAVLAMTIRAWVRRRVRGSGQASRGRSGGGGSQA
jgi:hypothetical protein